MTSDWKKKKKKLLASTYHDEPNANFCREVPNGNHINMHFLLNGYKNRVTIGDKCWQKPSDGIIPVQIFFYGELQRGMLRSVFLCWPMELLVSQHSVRATEESMQPRRFFFFFFTSPIGERWWKHSIWGGRVGGEAGGGATAGRRRALCCKCSLKCHSSNMLPVNSR